MQVISKIALCAILVSSCARAEPPLASGSPGQPLAVTSPPAPPELVPLAQGFQAAMANSQLQTYRYNQLTEQALALKKLCETGFGPSDICPHRSEIALGEGPAAIELPTVAAIDSSARGLFAVLVFADGRRLTVRPGTVLPGGLTVGAVTIDDVRVRMSAGGETALAFGDRGQPK